MCTSQTTLKIEKKYNITQGDKAFLSMSKMVLKFPSMKALNHEKTNNALCMDL